MQLRINSGPAAGQTVEVTGGEFTIGREVGCDLVLDDGKASRRHASIQMLPDGRATLYDLGSSNGTFVNGQQIQSTVLSGNEQVQIGDTVFQVANGTPAAAPVQPRAPAFQPPTPAPVARPSRTQSAIQRVMLQKAVNRATIVGVIAIVLAVA